MKMSRYPLGMAVAAAVAVAVALTASLLVAADPSTPHNHGATSRPSAGVVSLDVYAEAGGRRLHLLLATKPKASDAPPALQYVRSDDGGRSWADPVPVGQGQPPPDPAHRGMDAQVAAAGDRVVAVWTTAGTEDRFGRGPLATSFSADGGRTWRPGANPADGGRATGHAFADVAAGPDGTFHVVWLDGRDDGTAKAVGGESPGEKAGSGKGLRYARSTDGGATWSANVTLVARTCECCWNTIAVDPGPAGGRVSVLYRQASPRDMAVVSSADGGRTWGRPSAAGGFGWDINACPHVGGGLAFTPPTADAPADVAPALHAVVWTARAGSVGTYVLSSRDGGRTWADPLRLGTPRAWHSDVATAAGGRLAAVWDDNAPDAGGAGVFAATSRDGGRTWSAPSRLSDPAASPTHPRVVATPDGFRAFWTETREGVPAAWVGKLLP